MANEQTQVAKPEPTYSQRFSSMVVKEFGTQVGTLELSPYQQILAKHLFIGIDKALTDLEAKRVKDGKNDMAPIVWSNVNMQKLALDAVHRVELGLDALIPNHIHTIPYFNKKLKKYDLDLAVGYVGKDYYKREMAVEPPVNIIYQLVHETDTFKPRMRSATNDIESYEFEINNPFKRGPVIGGFGYIIYKDITQNKLVLVSLDSMNKSKGLAKTNTFWNAHEANMQMVVVVRRVTAELKVDPKKVNASFMAVELDDNSAEIGMLANQDVIDIEPEPADNGQGEKKEEKEMPPAKRGRPKKEEAPKDEPKNSGEHEWFHCPQKNQRVTLGICENNCNKFSGCDTAQKKIRDLMAQEKAIEATALAAASGAAAGGPAF